MWTFKNLTQIVFLEKLDAFSISYLKKEPTLLVVSEGALKRGKSHELKELLDKNQIPSELLAVKTSEPSTQTYLRDLSSQIRLSSFSQILAFGGPGVIDLAKLLKNELPQPEQKVVSLVALPTAIGSGAELTPFASLWDKKLQTKDSVESPDLLPNRVIYCPEFFETIPQSIMISQSLDGLTQCFDSFWSKTASFMSQALAHQGILAFLEGIPEVLEEAKKKQGGQKVILGSIFSGWSISITRTSICHALSYPLTLRFGTPHGLAVAFTLSSVMDWVQEKQPQLLMGMTPETCEKVKELLIQVGLKRELKKTLSPKPLLEDFLNAKLSPQRLNNFVLPLSSANIQQIINHSIHLWLE